MEDKASKLAAETVGLVRLDEFQKIKSTTLTGACAVQSLTKNKPLKSKLSFDLDEEDEEEPKRIRIGPSRVNLVESDPKETKIDTAAPILEAIRINSSFWDGQDHRFLIEGKKSNTIADLLVNAQQLYPPLKSQLVSSLLFVKENTILPHNMRVSDFVNVNAAHKNRPIFEFIQDDKQVYIDSVLHLLIFTFVTHC